MKASQGTKKPPGGVGGGSSCNCIKAWRSSIGVVRPRQEGVGNGHACEGKPGNEEAAWARESDTKN